MVSRLVEQVRTATFRHWADHLRSRLENAGKDRIRALVEGYFSFARGIPICGWRSTTIGSQRAYPCRRSSKPSGENSPRL